MNKKGEMPWWLILMILAILFLAIMSYVSGGLIKKAVSSVTSVQDKTSDQADCLALFGDPGDIDGDGFNDDCVQKLKDKLAES